MGPSTKEAVATGISTQTEVSTQQTAAQPSSAQSGAQPKAASSGSRSDAVSLEIGVRVHGSRVKAEGGPSAQGAGAQTEPFSEETTTMIVFPQGAVVRMTAPVHSGQMLVMTNLKSRQDAICRVIKVRNFPSLQSYVEVEFTQPQPKYWGVYFPSEGQAGARRPAPAHMPAAAPAVKTKITPDVVPAAAPARDMSGRESSAPKAAEIAAPREVVAARQASILAPPEAKPTLAYPAAESAAKIQGAASVVPQTITQSPTPNPVYEDQRYAAKARNEVAVQVPVLTPAEPKRRDAKPEVEPLAASVEIDPTGQDMVAPGAGVSAGRGLGAFGVAAELPAEQPAGAVEPIRGVFTDAQIGRELSPGWRQDWTLIGACAAVLLIAVLAGVWYFHSRTPASTVGTSEPASSVEQQPGNAVAPAQTPNAALVPPAATAKSATASTGTNYDALSSAPVVSETSREATAKGNDSGRLEAQPGATSGMAVASAPKNVLNPKLMKAHPLVSLRKDDLRNQAPALDPAIISASQPADLSAITSATSIAPPTPAGPVSIGGRIKEPRLISSTRPIYPLVAKQAHVEGDVVIDTLLDKNGNVSHLQVMSGPAMLRDAALDALRHWKFQPTQLDGQPVEVEMFVTVRFRL